VQPSAAAGLAEKGEGVPGGAAISRAAWG